MDPSLDSTRRARDWRGAMVAVVFAVVQGGAGVALAADTDGDLVDDAVDNCLLEPNGPNELSNQVDTDMDGYGNACDPDYNQDGLVTTGDTGAQYAATLTDGPLVGPDLLYDLDGDEHGTLNDLMIKFWYQTNQGTPGP